MNAFLAAGLNDDALSPMLLKELRQGLKSRAFYFAFLLMQGLMVFCVLMYLSALEADRNAGGFTAMFWTCIGATLVVITPLRALGALQQEIRGNTLELIFLTRLSAWRIVAGKWLALYSQALLLAAAALPYLLLRYFLGGINIADDLLVLFWLLVGSAVLTAAGVCFSTFALWLRIAVVVGMFVLPTMIGSVAAFTLLSSGTAAAGAVTTVAPAAVLVVSAVRSALVAALLLVWGASRIAPPAENHSRWKRLLTLAVTALLAAAAWAPNAEYEVLAGLIILVPMCIDALGEQPRYIPSLYAPFARRGLPGRIAGRFLYPGWPGGILFTLLACALYIAIAFQAGPPVSEHRRAMLCALPGALFFPLALVLTFRPRARNIFVGYLGIQIACLIITLIAAALHATLNARFPLAPLSFLPPCAFVLHLGGNAGSDASWMPVTACVTSLSLLLLLFATRPVTAQITALERAAASGDAPDAVPPK